MGFRRNVTAPVLRLQSPLHYVAWHSWYLVSILSLAALAWASLPACAQVLSRVHGRVDAAQVQVLRDHHPQWAIPQNSVGPATSNMVLTLVLSRTPEQQAAFDELVADQQNSKSPEFHHWLTPVEVGERFGLSDSDVTSVTGWLESQGLQVNWVSPSRIFIGFSGKADIVGSTFHTEIHNYRVHGIDRFSVSSDPMIPIALAPVVRSIQGLYTIEEHPTSRIIPARMASPNVTTSNGDHFITPEDFQKIYDGAVSYTGAGQTIGIVGRSRTYLEDFLAFDSVTNTPDNIPTEVIPTAFGGVDPGPPLTAPPTSGAVFGDQGEATLDVIRAGSIAPNANILLVVATSDSGGIEVDAQYLVETFPVPAQVMSISFGYCESAAGPAGVSFWDTLFEQAAAEGVSVFVSSGDSGAAGCDTAFVTPPSQPAANSANYICSSSYATCVGGTEFNDFTNPATYWNSANDIHLGSAYGYIPEGGWNEPVTMSGASEVASSGGGVSSYVATPAWQTGTGVPTARAGRYTPDVSFSSSCHDGYFGCFAAGGGGCTEQAGSSSWYFVYFCGTSAAAPAMAGVSALLDQKLGFPQGNLNREIYSLAQSTPSVYHDITVATSGVAGCSVNTPSMCNNSIPGPSGPSGSEAGYLLTAGYDLVTGLGSLDISNFLTSFTSPLTVPTITVTPSATTITALQPLTVTITLNGGSGSPAPTGTVKIVSNDVYSSSPTALSNGSATIVIPAQSMPGGNYNVTLTAVFTPDLGSLSTYTSVSGEAYIAVTLISPTISISYSPAAPTTAQGLTVMVKADGGTGNPTPTGQISLFDQYPAGEGSLFGVAYQATGTLASGIATITIPPGFLAPGNNTLSASYSPDTQSQPIFNTAGAPYANVSVSAGSLATPVVTVTPAASSITIAQPLTVNATVGAASGYPSPVGYMTLTGPNNISMLATVTNGSATFTVNAFTLSVGTDTLTVTYSGDFNNNGATGSAPVSVTGLAQMTPTVTVSPSPASISTMQPLNVTVTVIGGTGYPAATGSVSLVSGAYSTVLAFSNGTWTATIPGGSLTVGNDALNVTYTPDATSATVFNTATGTASVAVVAAAYTVTATAVTIGPGASGTSTLAVSSANDYAGTVSFKCSVTSSPAGASDLPTCTASQTVTLSSTTTSGQAVVTVNSTAPTAALHMPALRNGRGWFAGTGGALVAFVLFFVPRRYRLWQWIAIALFALVLFGTLSACGGGGSSVSTPPSNPGTTPGTYTLTVTGTGDDAVKSTASTTFSLTVN